MTPGQFKYRNEFLKSKEWSKIRTARMNQVRERFGAVICECCLVPIEGRWRHGHHVEYPADWYDTQPEKIRIVCPECHKAIHRLEKSGPIPFGRNTQERWYSTIAPLRAHIEERQVWWNQLQKKRRTAENERKYQELIKDAQPVPISVECPVPMPPLKRKTTRL